VTLPAPSEDRDLVSIGTPPKIEVTEEVAKNVPKWLLEKSYHEYPSLQVLKLREAELRLPSPPTKWESNDPTMPGSTEEHSHDQINIQVFPMGSPTNRTIERAIDMQVHLEAVE
jgi:hypothetical protein